MELRSLRHVLTLAKELNFTRAAQASNITQSALTRSIQTLEQDANVRLFDRDRGGVHLTPVGKVFVQRAAAIVREADDLKRLLKRVSQGEESEICFGVAPSPAKPLLSRLLLESITNNSSLRSNVSVRNAATLLTMLLDDKIEFIICAEGQIPHSVSITETSLGLFPLSLIVRAGHPLLGGHLVGEKPEYPVLIGSIVKDRANLPEYVRPYVWADPSVVLDDSALLAYLTEHSNAVWVSSSLSAADEIREGRLAEIPPPQGQKRIYMNIMMYRLERRTLSPAAENLVQKFADLIKSL